MFFVHCFVYAIRELGDVLHGRTGILGFVSSSLGLFSVRCSDSCLRYWHYLEHFHFLMMIGNKILEAKNGAAREGLMRCISELERVEADLTSLLRAEERYNDSNRAIAATL